MPTFVVEIKEIDDDDRAIISHNIYKHILTYLHFDAYIQHTHTLIPTFWIEWLLYTIGNIYNDDDT